MKSLVVLFAVVSAVLAAPHVEKRSVVAYALPSAVSHQSRVDVHSSPAVVTSVVEPVFEARVVPAATVYAAPAAVSHQSRVDVHSSPVVAAYAAPVVAAPSVYATPVATTYVGGSAVSHQSRVDVETSPAVVAEHVIAPAVVDARSVWGPSVYATAW